MALVIWLCIVGLCTALLGVEMTMTPPQTTRAKRTYRCVFVVLALIGLALTIKQSRTQEGREADTSSRLGTIGVGVLDVKSYVVSIYSNTSLIASASAVALARSSPSRVEMHGNLRLLSPEDESYIISKLKSAQPLETKIWLTSSQPEAEQLAQQIEKVFLKGGFTTAQVVRELPGGENMFPNQIAATNGVQVSTKELGGPILDEALVKMLD